jgi:hypothetical protein
MKTLGKSGNFIRVKEHQVEKKLAEGWQFVPKHKWKLSKEEQEPVMKRKAKPKKQLTRKRRKKDENK